MKCNLLRSGRFHQSIYQGADSAPLLKQVLTTLTERGYRIVNVDAIIFAQRPKLSPRKQDIRDHVAGLLGVLPEQVNIKAKTGTIAYSGPFPSLNGGSAPADANSDGIPDAFAAQHGISSPTQIKTDWDFGSYKVRNSAGYTALEMYLFSLTGDLIAGADGTL